MSIRIFRKAFGLLIVDIVIIIGIFVLQFRTDSSIIEKLGNLQITLEQLENQQNAISLKNKFLLNYNGFSLYCDDQHPVQILREGSNQRETVKLIDWKRITDTSCRFVFTNNVSFVLALTSDSPTATLTTLASLPDDVTDLFVPYNYSYNLKTQRNDGNRIIVDSKKSSWETTAYSLAGGSVNMNVNNLIASYAVYETTVKFTFDALTELAIATDEAYKNTIANFKKNLISSYKSNNSESSLNENSIIAYVAAMAETGEYAQAIEEVPQSFKRGKQRTYISAPYFNTLESMNTLLDQEVLRIKKLIADASSANNLEIFTTRDLAAKMCVSQSPKNCGRILERAAGASAEELTILQAAGILQTYAELIKMNPDYAKVLVPVLENCIQCITDACSFDGSVLTISENDTFLSVIQAVETGVAVMRYGAITGNQTLIKAGRVLINSYLSESSSFDLRTLATIYPVVAYDNKYYPHYQQIPTNDGRFVWAWTCAQFIEYNKEPDGTTTISIDFPEGLTHYVIIKGVPQFTSIYIYNMAFRTDPRFETYNSSGYVYKTDGNTLLLKSRHKARIETVKIEYDENVAKRRAEEAERAAKAAEAAKEAAQAATAEGESKETAPAEASATVAN